MRRLTALALALLLPLGALAEEAVAQDEVVDAQSPAFVEFLLEIARGELGYTEGPNNYTKYGEWSGDAHAEWCAEFVCWCVNEVDRTYLTELLDVVYPNYSGQNTGRDWFIARGRFVYRKGNCPDWGYQWLKGADHFLQQNEYIPNPGDLVFFSYNEAGDTEHVAIVEYCTRDEAGNVTVHVIEGNNPSSVARNSYALSNSQILGFGACQDVVDTTMRYGNTGDKVLLLQQKLNALGYLDERHLTGTFGSNTRAAVMAYQAGMEGQTVNGLADRTTQQAIDADYQAYLFASPESWLVTE
ncbi:MAG TPA: CHAP domain-containing protein [Candidatus Limiplasma stercoravium]|nr:CHAP domain-containing protein [Candidatus Limiplasma stercoravium]